MRSPPKKTDEAVKSSLLYSVRNQRDPFSADICGRARYEWWASMFLLSDKSFNPLITPSSDGEQWNKREKGESFQKKFLKKTESSERNYRQRTRCYPRKADSRPRKMRSENERRNALAKSVACDLSREERVTSYSLRTAFVARFARSSLIRLE